MGALPARPAAAQPDAAPEQGFVVSRGLRFPRDRSILTRRLINDLREGTYEFKEADAIRRIINPDDRVMELGGGIGFMSSLAARRCPEGRVHSYEANPTLIPYIEQVHAANGLTNVEVNHALLGPRKGSATFYVRRNFLGSSLERGNGQNILSEETVEIRNARAECKRIRPTVLLCDIEGAEAQVIPAMDLSTVRVAVLELHPQVIGSTGVNAVFEAMMKAGLAYFPRRSRSKVVCFRRGW